MGANLIALQYKHTVNLKKKIKLNNSSRLSKFKIFQCKQSLLQNLLLSKYELTLKKIEWNLRTQYFTS